MWSEFTQDWCRSAQPCRGRAAFTYTEILAALTMLTLVVGATFGAMIQSNRFALANRAYTCAETRVQSEIDSFLSVGPYSPPNLVPAELTSGTRTTNNVPIYVDSSTGQTVVTGTMTETVSDLGLSQTTSGVTEDLNIRQLKVRLDYTFAGKAYSISMNTLRASDS